MALLNYQYTVTELLKTYKYKQIQLQIKKNRHTDYDNICSNKREHTMALHIYLKFKVC